MYTVYIYDITTFSANLNMESTSVRRSNAKNKCGYWPVGAKQVCGKNCVDTYCAGHNKVMKNRDTPPQPCIKCGTGTFRSIQICTYCTPGGQYSAERYDAKIKKWLTS